MKAVYITLICLMLVSFSKPEKQPLKERVKTEKITGSSFSLINDTKEKVSIYTGTGFVSLNKGSKTSIGCNVGKEVRWANSGRKGDVIFKIESNMCGEVIKLSKFL